MQDKIEKSIELRAPVSRVWQALTDHEAFGTWFRVVIDAPFAVGQVSRGRVTYPGYEHMKWEATVVKMEAERLFSFHWCPYTDDAIENQSEEPQTLVEFRLQATAMGTRLDICESGFAALPDDDRRIDALRMNTDGWDEQARNISAYVEK